VTKEQQEKLIAATKNLVGKPYKYGAGPSEAQNVFDCSSFTQYIFKQVGIKLPRSSILQAADQQGQEIKPNKDFSNLEIGDLLFMRGVVGHYNDELFPDREIYIGHVAIHIGNSEVIHARQRGVIIEKLDDVIREPNYNIVYAKRF